MKYPQISNYIFSIVGFILSMMMTLETEARPEYALRIGNNRCTTCHFSPAGGGPKNMNGKYYGAFGFPLSKLSQQDFLGADVKMLFYSPEKHTEVRGGAGVMAVNLWASAPIVEKSPGSKEIRLVAEHNLGGYGGGSTPRGTYLRFQLREDSDLSWKPQFVSVGRLIVPFGLMTDEHRTYVRIQSSTAWNQALDIGAMASGNPINSLHYDIGVLNGQKNTGTAPAANQSSVFGGILNIRWMPTEKPFLLGLSTNYYDKDVGGDPPWAGSVYSVISLHRMTKEKVPASLLLEYVTADNWNNSTLTNYFVSDSTLATQISKSTSRGMLAQLNWDFGQSATITYKYDRLELDQNFPSDAYERHGLGIRHNFGPQLWAMGRYEIASPGHPSEKDGKKMGAIDAFWAVLNIGL